MFINRLSKLNPSSRNALSAALVAIAAVALYGWILAPHVTYLSAVQRYKPVADSVANESRALCGTLADKRSQLQQMREQFSQIRASLFTSQQAKEFLADLQHVAHKAGCTVTSMNFLPDQQGPVIIQDDGELSVVAKTATLGLSAGYDDVIGLLQNLRSRPQKVWIDSFSMELLDVRSSRLGCTLSITIYCLQNKEAPING